VVLASCCFGTSGPFAKPIMEAGLSPQQVASARIGLAALIMLAVLALTRRDLLRVRRANWRLLIAYGLAGVALAQVMYFAAVQRIPIGVAMLLEFTAPILVALWVRFVRGTRLPGQAWVGTVLALAGLAMVAQVWDGLAFDVIGMLAGAGAALGAAAYFLLGEHGVSSIEPLTLVTWGLVVGAVVIFVWAPPWTIPFDILNDSTTFGSWHPPVWTLIVAVAVFSTSLAYLFSISAMRHLPSNVVSVLSLCEPVVATAVAWAFLGQSLTAIQVLGAAVLLGGATLVQVTSNLTPE
jgi:drug/metabolite transporter (DMT)-like permease